jgi:hypothetical protein
MKTIGLLLTITLAVAGQVYAQSFLTNGLVAYYPFNGNANDASGNGHAGVVNGATLTQDRFGQSGMAYAFNGSNSFITCNIPNIPTGAAPRSISLWAAANPPPAGVVLACWGASQNSKAFGIINNSSPYTWQGFLYGFPDDLNSGVIVDTNWHHVAIVYDGANVSISIDGVQKATGSRALNTGFSPLIVGAGVGGTTEFFRGTINNVRIYNRALSTNEVQQLFAYESTGPVQPRTATASAVLSYGFVVAVNITDGGSDYTNTPTVRMIGGGGTGAQAVAVVSNGVVTAINILDAGSGYTNAPLVVIEPPFIPNPVLGIAPMSFLAFSNLTLGGVYQLQQSLAWYWSNQPVNFTATNSLYTQMVPGVAGSGDYRLALNPVPAQAFATAEVDYGFVVHATVTSGGSGYVTSPAVTIVGGGGSNATAVAQISGGVVTNITITSPGTGYTSTPTVQIAQPPAAAVSPTVLPVMRVDSASLAPYDNYQVQFKPDLSGAWGNWSGGLFNPTGVTSSQYLFITNGVGFFRLQYVP